MADYGLIIKNSNGNIIWQSTDLEHFEVVDNGSVSNGSSVSFDEANEILALNAPDITTDSTTRYLLRGNTSDGSWTNASGFSVNWIRVKRTTQQSITTSSAYNNSTYGLETYDASTPQNITFSSGFEKGTIVLAVHQPDTLTGNDDSDGTYIYTGDPTGVYITPSKMVYQSGPYANSLTAEFDCAAFLYGGTQGIRYRSYYLRYVSSGGSGRDGGGTQTANYTSLKNRSFLMALKRNG